MSEQSYESEIAIIGMAGRFPGAINMSEFWDNLCGGVEAITFFSEEELLEAGVPSHFLADPNYIRAKGILQDTDMFDAYFFGMTPREAEIMDPQQRLFLECAWEALEDGGYDAERFNGRIGVYAGTGMSTYLFNLLLNPDMMRLAGFFQIKLANDKDFLATRVSYKLGLKGPSVSIQTACSTSLVAVHMACQTLLGGECDMALAGASSVSFPHKTGYLYEKNGIMSPDGHCRAFDAESRGTVAGNGVAVVVLKRLPDAIADRDHIHAVIKGSAVNNDGSLKPGFTSPSIEGQSTVIRDALLMAGSEPDDISYVETHGTGTPLGDEVEITALKEAHHGRSRSKPCALGSVKTNIGHLDTAAGVVGLIKTVLALKHGRIPPSLNLKRANPKLGLDDSPFYVNTALCEWSSNGGPRRAGVSSFGIGGTNAHVIVEQAPAREDSEGSRPYSLLILSTRTETAIELATDRLADHLEQNQELSLADIAYTLQVGRKEFTNRRIAICRNVDEAVKALRTRDPKRVITSVVASKRTPVAFMFPGVGDHYVNMAAQLYETEPSFRKHFDTCLRHLRAHTGIDFKEVLHPHGTAMAQGAQSPVAAIAETRINLKDMLRRGSEQANPAASRLNQTELAQPAVFIVEYALARMWMDFGVVPQSLIGYSLGEHVAACVAGVFSLEDGLMLVARRAQMIGELPPGAMVAVAAEANQIEPLLPERVSVSALDGPMQSVASGPTGAIEELEYRLAEKNLTFNRLRVRHAFHSEMMVPMKDAFIQLVSKVRLMPPKIPFISTLTGRWITENEATDPVHWGRQMCEPIRFSEGLKQLADSGVRTLLEVGPGQNLSSIAIQNIARSGAQPFNAVQSLRSSYEQEPDESLLVRSLGKLWLSGVSIDWAAYHSQERLNRVPLPTVPFERQRYWVAAKGEVFIQSDGAFETSDSLSVDTSGIDSTTPLHGRPGLAVPFVEPCDELQAQVAEIWQELLGIEGIGINDNFFELGGNSLVGTQLITRVRETLMVELQIRSIFEHPTVAELAESIELLFLEQLEEMPED
jgi:acyl transferase domain-containing protein